MGWCNLVLDQVAFWRMAPECRAPLSDFCTVGSQPADASARARAEVST